MDPKDAMVLMTLVSYIFMLIGFATVLFLIFQRLCGLSSRDARNYAIGGTILLVAFIWWWIKKESDKWLLNVQKYVKKD